MTTKTSRSALSAPHLASRLGLAEWQIKRAEAEHLIPARDRSKGWSADLADQLAERADEVRTAVGTVADKAGFAAAEYLSKRFGVEVGSSAVAELARMGHLRVLGRFDGYEVYCGRSLEAFDDRAALNQAATQGRLMIADTAAEYLQVRRSDVDHLIRAALLRPAKHARSGHRAKKHGLDMALYRAGDLDALLADKSIDWDAVRATPKGHRSPLARLTTAGTEGQ